MYGGTIAAGCAGKRKLDIVSSFEAPGQLRSGDITPETFKQIVRQACPGPGACGGMYTANTMASAIEGLGMALPFNASMPADGQDKRGEVTRVGAAIRRLLELNLKPRDIQTRESFENAMRLVIVLGGSTNAVLHLLALAKTAHVPLTIDDFRHASDNTPYLADLKPSGKYVMEDLSGVGGVPGVMKLMLREGLLHGDAMTVTGKTMGENLEQVPDLDAGQKIIHPVASPIKPDGHIRILRGNLAEDGAVAKITGKEGERFEGTARCYDAEDLANAAILAGEVKSGDVVVIRYCGPRGGPGHAGDAQADGLCHGHGPRAGGSHGDGRALLGRDARLRGGARDAGGPGRRRDCARGGRRPHRHRREGQYARGGFAERRARREKGAVGGAGLEGRARVAAEVRADGKYGERGVRDGRVSTARDDSAYLGGMTLLESPTTAPPAATAAADDGAATVPTLVVPRKRMRYTVARYHEAIAIGLLNENDGVELLFGEIVKKMSIGKRHRDCVDRLNRYFMKRVSDDLLCCVQNPITIPDHSEPEPDYAIVNEASYRQRAGNPEPPDILLVVEVADSTLDTDRIDKAKLYAMAGLPEYWIVNLRQDQLELHTEPDVSSGIYNAVRRFSAEKAFESPFCGEVAVADLLP